MSVIIYFMEEWLSRTPREEDYEGHYFYPEDMLTKAIKEWCESCPKLLDWQDYHCKFGVVVYHKQPREDYEQQLEIYDSIKDANISPVLVFNEIVYNKYPIFVYLLVTEKYGQDLEELFMDSNFSDGSSSNKILGSMNKFEQVFPPDKIPKLVRDQILPLLQRFQDIGWIHRDVWCANLLLKDGVVKLIDFEYCTKIS